MYSRLQRVEEPKEKRAAPRERHALRLALLKVSLRCGLAGVAAIIEYQRQGGWDDNAGSNNCC